MMRPEIPESLLCLPSILNRRPDDVSIEPASSPELESTDLGAVERLGDAHRRITRELHQVIVGQQEVVEELLIAMTWCNSRVIRR